MLESGDAWHGATVHFVTEELDGGPAILQARIRVFPGDTEATLARRVQAREHRIYPRAVDWFLSGRLEYRDGMPFLNGEPLQEPRVLEENTEPT